MIFCWKNVGMVVPCRGFSSEKAPKKRPELMSGLADQDTGLDDRDERCGMWHAGARYAEL
jgi:hypothetical protein